MHLPLELHALLHHLRLPLLLFHLDPLRVLPVLLMETIDSLAIPLPALRPQPLDPAMLLLCALLKQPLPLLPLLAAPVGNLTVVFCNAKFEEGAARDLAVAKEVVQVFDLASLVGRRHLQDDYDPRDGRVARLGPRSSGWVSFLWLRIYWTLTREVVCNRTQ